VSTDNRVSTVEFAPNGRTLAVATLERSVELWDVTRPPRPARLGQTFGDPNSTAPVNVAFAADGRLLAVPNANGATLWELQPLLDQRDTAPDRACLIAGRGLTAEEWADAIPGVDYEPTCD
jgi:WD40 repeat protein